MNPTERILRTMEGKPVDRIPTFCAGLEERTVFEVLGQPLIQTKTTLANPVTQALLNKWGPQMTKPFVQPAITSGMDKRIKAAAQLGFDATWALYDETFIVLDAKNMARYTGALFEMQDDGYGNMTYMYKGPGITSRAEFEAWPYWPDADAVAQRAYKFFKKMLARYGDQICFCGQASAYGIQESLLWTIGFEKVPFWIRKEKDLVERFIAMAEELCLKTSLAMLDAGVEIILQSDDFAFKTGPMMNPKMIDQLFGPSYRRIIKAVHDRGGKYILHSCGDNTVLFDTLIDWGVDGLHAYENTSTVDIFKQKEVHGDRVTMIGGVGIDYLLTERSRDEEVVEMVQQLIKKMGPGGRYLLGPIHGMSNMPAAKLKVMIEACHKYGSYPINLN